MRSSLLVATGLLLAALASRSVNAQSGAPPPPPAAPPAAAASERGAPPAVAPRAAEPPAEGPSAQRPAQPSTWSAQAVMLIAVISILATLPIALLWYDIRKAYEFADRTRGEVITRTSQDGLSLDELRLLLVELGQAPPGVPGLARTMMAFMLMLILGVALFHMLFNGTTEVAPLVDKTLTVLTTALTSMMAFYFGARTAETAGAQATVSTGSVSPPRPVSPTIRGFAPESAAAGSEVTVEGQGFGTTGEVTFGSTKATNTMWSANVIKARVPPGLTPGVGVPIVVTPFGATPISSTPRLFNPQ